MNEKDFLNTLKEYCKLEEQNELYQLLSNCQLFFNYTNVFASKSYQFRAYVDLRAPIAIIKKLREYQKILDKICGDIFVEDEKYAFYGIDIKPIITHNDDIKCETENNGINKKNFATELVNLKISEKALEALAQTITGDNGKSFYRKGYELVEFFNAFGFEDIYDQGFPSRIQYARDKLFMLNHKGKINQVFESLLDPRDYIEIEYSVKSVAEYLNKYLFYDKLKLVNKQNYYRLDKLNSMENESVEHKIDNEDTEFEVRDDNGVKVFISYSHVDEEMRKELDKHLKMLRRKNVISTWYDRAIDAGAIFDKEIEVNLKTSNIIVLLISVDFLASDYCYDTEMKIALDMHEKEIAIVVPVILRNCDWQSTPFSKLLALPTDGKSVSTWADKDTSYLNIAKGIENIAIKLIAGK